MKIHLWGIGGTRRARERESFESEKGGESDESSEGEEGNESCEGGGDTGAHRAEPLGRECLRVPA